jgi:hypothetical protein
VSITPDWDAWDRLTPAEQAIRLQARHLRNAARGFMADSKARQITTGREAPPEGIIRPRPARARRGTR